MDLLQKALTELVRNVGPISALFVPVKEFGTWASANNKVGCLT